MNNILNSIKTMANEIARDIKVQGKDAVIKKALEHCATINGNVDKNEIVGVINKMPLSKEVKEIVISALAAIPRQVSQQVPQFVTGDRDTTPHTHTVTQPAVEYVNVNIPTTDKSDTYTVSGSKLRFTKDIMANTFAMQVQSSVRGILSSWIGSDSVLYHDIKGVIYVQPVYINDLKSVYYLGGDVFIITDSLLGRKKEIYDSFVYGNSEGLNYTKMKALRLAGFDEVEIEIILSNAEMLLNYVGVSKYPNKDIDVFTKYDLMKSLLAAEAYENTLNYMEIDTSVFNDMSNAKIIKYKSRLDMEYCLDEEGFFVYDTVDEKGKKFKTSKVLGVNGIPTIFPTLFYNTAFVDDAHDEHKRFANRLTSLLIRSLVAEAFSGEVNMKKWAVDTTTTVPTFTVVDCKSPLYKEENIEIIEESINTSEHKLTQEEKKAILNDLDALIKSI